MSYSPSHAARSSSLEPDGAGPSNWHQASSSSPSSSGTTTWAALATAIPNGEGAGSNSVYDESSPPPSDLVSRFSFYRRKRRSVRSGSVSGDLPRNNDRSSHSGSSSSGGDGGGVTQPHENTSVDEATSRRRVRRRSLSVGMFTFGSPETGSGLSNSVSELSSARNHSQEFSFQNLAGDLPMALPLVERSPLVRSIHIFPPSPPSVGSKAPARNDIFVPPHQASVESTWNRSRPQRDLARRYIPGFEAPSTLNRCRHQVQPVASPGKAVFLLVHEDPSHTGQTSSGEREFTPSPPSRVRYLPLCLVVAADESYPSLRHDYTLHPSFQDRFYSPSVPAPQSTVHWPRNMLPVELFDMVTRYLSRDDMKAMRLVSKEFEEKTSRSMFYTSVVPFNTEIYDMIDQRTKFDNREPATSTKPAHLDNLTVSGQPGGSQSSGLFWQNAMEDKDDKMYKGHGIRVFQGFGPHIKRFGMSFEVSEHQLVNLPTKEELDLVESYYGRYKWPQHEYNRFSNLAGLEQTADETSRMKAAFSHLTMATELALSIDSGLGWLVGPDKSAHARIFERSSPVFGTDQDVHANIREECEEFWWAIEQCVRNLEGDQSEKEITLSYRSIDLPLSSIIERDDSGRYKDTSRWPTMEAKRILPELDATKKLGCGVLVVTCGQRADPLTIEGNSIQPAELSKEQKEWLLETEWAQRAFLESYMLAIVDNPTNFQKITSLKISRMSSRYLSMLARDTFWQALPCLNAVTLLVIANWRTVEKNDTGAAVVKAKLPCDSVKAFHEDIILGRIAPRESIKTLNIGWCDGGEHAQGIYARNNHILPAPLCPLGFALNYVKAKTVLMPYVEDLTLTNCWITPSVLEGLVKRHASLALRTLTLDSVSLTVQPRPADNDDVPHFLAAPVTIAVPHIPGNFAPHMPVAGPMTAMQAAAAQQQWANPAYHPHQNPFHPNTPATANGTGPNPAALLAHHQNIPPGPLMPPQQLTLTSINIAQWRPSSWPAVLDTIAPGPDLYSSRSQNPPSSTPDQDPSRPSPRIQTLVLKSCGYARFLISAMDQSVLDDPHPPALSRWFQGRAGALKTAMLEARTERFHAHIVQYISPYELALLSAAWGLRTGWVDPLKALEPTFDGLLPGGTGRISGKIVQDVEIDETEN